MFNNAFVFLAEDDELMLRTVEFRLKKDGHEVILARDGRDALQKIDEYQPQDRLPKHP